MRHEILPIINLIAKKKRDDELFQCACTDSFFLQFFILLIWGKKRKSISALLLWWVWNSWVAVGGRIQYIHSYSKDGSIHNEMTKLALTWIQRGL